MKINSKDHFFLQGDTDGQILLLRCPSAPLLKCCATELAGFLALQVKERK